MAFTGSSSVPSFPPIDTDDIMKPRVEVPLRIPLTDVFTLGVNIAQTQRCMVSFDARNFRRK